MWNSENPGFGDARKTRALSPFLSFAACYGNERPAAPATTPTMPRSSWSRAAVLFVAAIPPSAVAGAGELAACDPPSIVGSGTGSGVTCHGHLPRADVAGPPERVDGHGDPEMTWK